MRPLILIPFASEVHRKEYYAGVLEVFKSCFRKYGIDFHEEVVTSYDKVEIISKKYRNFIPIALILTGGTSRLVYEFVVESQLDRLFILSHGEHNSLASAISARSKLEYEGVSTGLYYCNNPYSKECEFVIDKVMAIARTVAGIIGAKVGVIADRKREESDEIFESKFDAIVDIISFDEIEKEISEISNDVLVKTMDYIRGRIGIEKVDTALKDISKLYIALKSIVSKRKLDAITIDCFPYIEKYGITPCIPLALLNSEGIVAGCEADLAALVGLMIARYITGKSGWIANPALFNSRHALFAHCTVALDIVDTPSIAPHFETGNPYAVSGKMIADMLTLISIDREFSIAAVAKGRIVKSGLLQYPTCRNQIMVEFDYITEEIPRYAPSNHHVAMLGDHISKLMDVGYMLGMDVVEYRELVR